MFNKGSGSQILISSDCYCPLCICGSPDTGLSIIMAVFSTPFKRILLHRQVILVEQGAVVILYTSKKLISYKIMIFSLIFGRMIMCNNLLSV